MSNLDSYIITIGMEITKFNRYVRLLIDSLAARGETSNDLLTNLFKGYEAAIDKTFVDYIGGKKERYEEGEDATSDALMEQANSKYKLMKENLTWNAPSKQEERILALMSEVKNLKKFKKKDSSYKRTTNPTAARKVRKKDATLSKSLHGSQKNQARRTSFRSLTWKATKQQTACNINPEVRGEKDGAI
jgi:hypothetical protein